MNLQERIKEARKDHGLSREELADLLGLKAKDIKAIEEGNKIEDGKLVDLLKVLNISLDEYIKLRDNSKSEETKDIKKEDVSASDIEVDEEIIKEGILSKDKSKRLRKFINTLSIILIFLSLCLLALPIILWGITILILPFFLGAILLSSVSLYLMFGKFSMFDFEIHYYLTDKRIIRKTVFKSGTVKIYEARYEDLTGLTYTSIKGIEHIKWQYKEGSKSLYGNYFYSLDGVENGDEIYKIITKMTSK